MYRSYKSEYDTEYLASYTPRKSDPTIYRLMCPNCHSNDYVLPLQIGLVPAGVDIPDANQPPKKSHTCIDEGYRWDCTRCMIYFNTYKQ